MCPRLFTTRYVHASNNASLKMENSKSHHKNVVPSADPAKGGDAPPAGKTSGSRSPSRKSSLCGSVDDVRACLLSPEHSQPSRTPSITPPVEPVPASVSAGGFVTSTV